MRKNLLKIGLLTISSIAFFDVLRKSIKNIVGIYENERDRYMCYYYTLREWIFNKQNGKSIEEYFQNNNIKTVAIYGIGTLGKLLYNDIKNYDIKIQYIIDNSCADIKKYQGVPIIKLKDIKLCLNVDAIIITPIGNYIEIIQDIEKYDTKIQKISLQNLIFRNINNDKTVYTSTSK